MEKVFVIGGMGAGKSTVLKALVDAGLTCIDLDKVGHALLHEAAVKSAIADTFGADVLDEDGEVVRSELARRAFADSDETRKLNGIMHPRIEDALNEQLDMLEQQGCEAVVVEYSAFEDRSMPIARLADTVVAVVAPLQMRVDRAIAAGFDGEDVRRRIDRQIADAERIRQADVVFENDGSKEELYGKVQAWWKEFTATA